MKSFIFKYSKIKTLGESDDEDENAATWVRRVRKMQKEKAMAEKRVSYLEGMGGGLKSSLDKMLGVWYYGLSLPGLWSLNILMFKFA